VLPHEINLFYGSPSPGNSQANLQFALNRFSVTRQLRYSRDETARALDLGLFMNGLPIATFELKNSLTKQTVDDAVEHTSGTATRARSCSSSEGVSPFRCRRQ
jgi:type I restriction enzyme, R subunit